MDENERTLWCGNISEKVTEEHLYELFLQGGPLEKVRIPKDSNGKPRRFAFIVYKHSCSVPYAAALFEGTSLFQRVLRLQQQTTGGEANQSPNLTSHQRALSCPVNLNAPPNPMIQLNTSSSLMGPIPDTNGIQQMLTLYQNQLMSIPSPVGITGNMGSLAKSSLMGTWNRNTHLSSSLREERDHNRHKSDGYNRMEPYSRKKYDREPESHKRYNRDMSHKQYNNMEPDFLEKSDHHGRRYHHRRDYR